MFVNTFFYFFTLILLYYDRLGITKDVYYCLLPTGFFLLSSLNAQPRLRILSGSASTGGVRFLDGGNLRCWKKSSCLSDAGASSGFFSAVLADFQRLRSQPPTKPQTGQYPESRRPFRHKDMLKEDSPTKKEKRPHTHAASQHH